jgi:hypothetical protein
MSYRSPRLVGVVHRVEEAAVVADCQQLILDFIGEQRLDAGDMHVTADVFTRVDRFSDPGQLHARKYLRGAFGCPDVGEHSDLYDQFLNGYIQTPCQSSRLKKGESFLVSFFTAFVKDMRPG